MPRYRRGGGQLEILWSGGQKHTLAVEEKPYELMVEGVACRRADFDLSGRFFEGTWRLRGGGVTRRLGADGAFSGNDGEGRYRLGPRTLTWVWADGREETLPLLSDLKPRSRHPDVLFIGGVAWDREG